MDWISIKREELPIYERDTFFLIAHKFGVEYVYWDCGRLKYCYCAKSVDLEVLKTISHWCKPTNPNNE